MSGPKVVRVVTREELEAICQRHIALVDAAIRGVRAVVKRHDLDEKELLKGLVIRRDELVDLLERGRFAELRKNAPAVVQFCQGEASRLEAKAAAAIEAARSKRRRLSDTARSVLGAFDARGLGAPAALKVVVARSLVASEGELQELEKVVSDGLAQLSSVGKAGGTTRQDIADLAQRLAAGARELSLEGWRAENGVKTESSDTRLDKVLAEVELLGDASLTKAFSDRAARVAEEGDVARRRLLTDSLVLDASGAAQRLKAIEAYKSQLRDAQAALVTFSADEAQKQAAAIGEALAKPDLAIDKGLLKAAIANIERAQAQLAAAARRKAILGGLVALGYEVREGMATAWTEKGRLVVRKPNSTDYGVELAAPEDASRLQVRLVGAANPVSARSAGRDRDQEAMWCSEFGKLSELVAANGGDVVIERALAVGAQAVKTVAFDDVVADRAEDVAPRERRL
jgi:hypothetical protein